VLIQRSGPVTDCVFDIGGGFHPLAKIDSDQATIVFRKKVLAMMKERNVSAPAWWEI